MAKQLFLNNFVTTFIASVLGSPVTGTPATELGYGILQLDGSAGGMLANPTGGDYYLLTAFKRSGSVESSIEILKVTAVDTVTAPGETRITVTRAQESTTAQAFVSGDHVQLRLTKGGAANFPQVQNNLSDLANADTALGNLGLTADGRDLVKAANYAAMKVLLGLVIGTNVQAYDAELAALAGLASAADKLPYFTGSGTAALADMTAVARTLLAATTQANQRTALGLGTSAVINIDTDGTLAANSDTILATQKAVKTYADQLLAANDALVFKGSIDCSANPNYPAADCGHLYRISVAGKIGGASGVNVEAGDTITCRVDGTSAGNQATVGANWIITQANLDGAVIGPASATSANIATFSGTSGKLIQDSGKALPSGTILGTTDSQAVSNKALGSGTSLGADVTGGDFALTRVMLKDTGHVYHNSSTTNALDYINGQHQRWTPNTGAQTLSISNWPPSGNLGELVIEGVNLGAATITWPTINWVKNDGTTTTTFSSNGVTLQASGIDWVFLWTRDGGTTIYGKIVR